MEKAKLKISNKLSAIVKIGNTELNVPKEYKFENRDLHGVDCEVERQDGKIVRIVVNGKDLPKDDHEVQRKEEAAKKRVEEAAAERVRQQAEQRQAQQLQQPQFVPQGGGGFVRDSFDMKLAQVPKDVRNLTVENPDNFNLKFNKYARLVTTEDKKTGLPKYKFEFFKKDKFLIKGHFGNMDFKGLAEREARNALAVFGKERTEVVKMKPQGRLIIGLGGHSVYEVAITLHHIYGIPFIPASSIKGVLRSYIINNVETFQNNEGLAIHDKAFCDIFGCPSTLTVEIDNKKQSYTSHYKEAKQGNATFFDAFPMSEPTIAPDVMNPHYGEWYGKGKAPTDTMSPIPVFFPTVHGADFQFIIASKKEDFKLFKGKTLINWLKEALTEQGIGAKTAIGYGYFNPVT
jgi:CRISPR-associated protein Cmr6